MGNLALVKSRIRIMVLCMVAVFGLLAGQLIRVQVIQANHYQNKAANEMESTRVIPAPRGEITDINGLPFARSVAAISIVVDQTQITDPTKVANFVAPILGLSISDVQSAITGTRKYSIVLKNGRPILWEQLTQKIYDYNQSLRKDQLDQRIIGFFPERSYIREYPSGSLISSLVGFVGSNGVGSAGLEYSLNSIISGVDGRYSYAGGNGAEIPGSQREIVAAKAGTSIRLTIDRDVQWVAAQAISEAVKKANAQSGTVIVMDPRTGAILAHAINDGLDGIYRQAIENEKLRPLGAPSANVVSAPDEKTFAGNLVVEIEVEVRPEIKLPETKGLKVTVDAIKVSDEEVDAEVSRLRARFGSLKTVERPAATGDFTTIDLVASLNGEQIDQAQNISYEIGDNSVSQLNETANGSLVITRCGYLPIPVLYLLCVSLSSRT